ncbi:MAG: serine hydrolase [Alphaproteobacteria bacterium]
MTSSQQIQQLSQQPSALGNHICDEPNINPWAIHAVHFKGGELQSSLSQGFTSLAQDGKAIDQNTRFGVGSLTKMFTSAGLLKLWDDELTDLKTSKLSADQTTTSSIDNFPKINFPLGIDTPLSHFMERLKNKFPESTYLSKIEEVAHYPKVTLRDLLNHTHGLGAWDEEQIAKFQLQNPNHEFIPNPIFKSFKKN